MDCIVGRMEVLIKDACLLGSPEVLTVAHMANVGKSWHDRRLRSAAPTVEISKVEHDRPPTPNQIKKQHHLRMQGM